MENQKFFWEKQQKITILGVSLDLIPIIEAQTYLSVFNTGRTAPCAVECINEQGIGSEYVVKLYGSIETGKAGLLREIVASQIASFLGFTVPEPAIINITEDFVRSVPDLAIRQRMANSFGLNFGSKNTSGGFITWPTDKSLPRELKQLASEIYFFDMLVQNPDRRRGKPNILWRGDKLVLIDHELAFSFLLDIVPQKDEWKVSSLQFPKDHIFYFELRNTALNFDRIMGAIESISDHLWSEIETNVPNEWNSENLIKIKEHIKLVQANLEHFIDDVRRTLL